MLFPRLPACFRSSRRPYDHRSPKRSPFTGGALVALLLATGAVVGVSCAKRAVPAPGDLGEQVTAAIASGTARFEHGIFDGLTAAGTRDGLVDYDYFRAHRAELDRYLESIANANLASLRRDELMALLINAYNAYTIESILEHPGTSSIRQIDGVWNTATHRVGGFEVTLDNIEHNLLRPFFKDPRVHVAVNCASWSCAPLPPWAFVGDRLQEQLEQWTQTFFRDPKYCRVEGDKLLVSSLLDWYGEDFTKPSSAPRADSLAQFIERYTDETTAAWLDSRGNTAPISFLDYDWSLNQAPAGSP